MIKIYFDDILIDTNSYTDLSNEYELFSNDFYLGSTASNYFKFSIDKTKVNGIPQKITIKDDDKNIAVLHPDSIKESKYTFDYECTDILTLMEKPYDASSLIETSSTGHITLLELVQDICSKYSIELGTTDFLGYDKQISWYDNSRNARTYIGYVAELNGGYATVENDGKLYFKKQNKTSSLNISINNCDDFSIGEYHKITRVVFDNGVVKYEFGTNDGDVIYLDAENVFITEESDVENIYNSVKNLEFYTFEVGNCPVSIDVRAGDIISFVDGNNIYKTIAGYSLYYYGLWQGNYKLDVQTNIKKETQITSLDKKIKNISSRINYDEAELKIVAEKVSDNETSIGQLEITSENITSRVQTTEDNISDLENVNKTLSDRIDDKVNKDELNEIINTVKTTILEQTSESFTMWFEETGLQGTLDTMQNELDDATENSNTLKEYIHFEGAEITLGRSDSQTKLVIKNDRISFMTGDTESAYISENTLYITDSTILNKMQIGHWETKEDENGNLNIKWIGGNS